MKPKTIKICIWMDFPRSKEVDVECVWIGKHFAVHRPYVIYSPDGYKPKGWKITHIPSGQAPINLYTSKQDAIRRAKEADKIEGVNLVSMSHEARQALKSLLSLQS